MKSNTQIVSVEFSNQIQSSFKTANREKTIDARLVHSELGVKYRFERWIDQQITHLEIEPKAITDIHVPKSKRGRPQVGTYLLSPRDTKEILIASRTQRGKAVRKWYLDLEESVAEGLIRLDDGFDSAEMDTLRALARHVTSKSDRKLAELDARLERIERRSNSMVGLLSRIMRLTGDEPEPTSKRINRSANYEMDF